MCLCLSFCWKSNEPRTGCTVHNTKRMKLDWLAWNCVIVSVPFSSLSLFKFAVVPFLCFAGFFFRSVLVAFIRFVSLDNKYSLEPLFCTVLIWYVLVVYHLFFFLPYIASYAVLLDEVFRVYFISIPSLSIIHDAESADAADAKENNEK